MAGRDCTAPVQERLQRKVSRICHLAEIAGREESLGDRGGYPRAHKPDKIQDDTPEKGERHAAGREDLCYAVPESGGQEGIYLHRSSENI